MLVHHVVVAEQQQSLKGLPTYVELIVAKKSLRVEYLRR